MANNPRDPFARAPLPDPGRRRRARPRPGPAGRNIAGIGLFGVDVPDWVEDAADTFVDATTAVATGGASLLSPVKPSEVLSNPGGFLSSAGGGVKSLLKSAGAIGAKGLITTGKALTGGGQQAAPAPAPAPAPNYLPWILGGAGVIGLVLLLKKKKGHH